MEVFDQMTGQKHLFPDDVDPAQAQTALAGFAQQQSQQQQLMQGLSGIGKMIVQSMPVNYQPTYATMSPKVAMAMRPQDVQATLDRQQGVMQQQQQQQFQAQQAQQDRSIRQQHLELQQRQSVAYELQREKDRSQQLSLEDKRFKNEQKIQKMRQQAQDAEEKRKQEQPQLDTSRGVQWQMNPETGQYEQQILDQNMYDRATRMPGGGGGGAGGGGGGRADKGQEVITAADGTHWWKTGGYDNTGGHSWTNGQTIVGQNELRSILGGQNNLDPYTAAKIEWIDRQLKELKPFNEDGEIDGRQQVLWNQLTTEKLKLMQPQEQKPQPSNFPPVMPGQYKVGDIYEPTGKKIVEIGIDGIIVTER